MGVLLGAIADDFTGATDLANTLVKEGMRTVQTIGAPSPEETFEDVDAVVVALKSRTNPPAEALAMSLTALSRLQALGARQIVFKYCSTFDSTAEGNIGPVADALLHALETDLAVVCPAFPGAGRTIYQGHLFVHDQLLAESPMKDHPLTPMRDSDLRRLMAVQSAHDVGLVPLSAVARGPQAVREALDDVRATGARYAVADALTDDDLRAIGRALGDAALVTGGSGVAMGLPANFRDQGLLNETPSTTPPAGHGRALILAGSCSTATRAQIARAAGDGAPHRRLDVDRLDQDLDAEVRAAAAWVDDLADDAPAMITASADPAEVAATQARLGRERAGWLVEAALARLAIGLVDGGAASPPVGRLIVAGGESSGAVVSALEVRSLRIGPEIAPGVPWTEARRASGPPLALALKSGNFGQEDFFTRAFEMLS